MGKQAEKKKTDFSFISSNVGPYLKFQRVVAMEFWLWCTVKEMTWGKQSSGKKSLWIVWRRKRPRCWNFEKSDFTYLVTGPKLIEYSGNQEPAFKNFPHSSSHNWRQSREQTFCCCCPNFRLSGLRRVQWERYLYRCWCQLGPLLWRFWLCVGDITR